MAMKFREPNMTKWRGVRPGHNGIQIAWRGDATAALPVAYTVTPLKTLYLVETEIEITTAVVSNALLRWRTGAVTVRFFGYNFLMTAAGVMSPYQCTFWPPLEIPSDDTIQLVVAGAGSTASAEIHGWEE